MNADVRIRRIRPDDAGRARALRLEMLADTPLAFITTLADAAAKPHSEFAARCAAAAVGPTTGQFVAEVLGQNRFAGQVIAAANPLDPETTSLYAVYVAPAYRGDGVLSGLIDAAAEWSRECGRPRLALEVVTNNHRAVRAYEKLAFVADPHLLGHPTIPTITETRMTRPA